MDFKALVDELKKEGLDLAEDAAEKVVKVIFNWVEAEVIKSENKYDDMVLAVLPALKPIIFKAIDKIDGNVDELPETVTEVSA